MRMHFSFVVMHISPTFPKDFSMLHKALSGLQKDISELHKDISSLHKDFLML
ncbi:MAG TPA: hypothetical protein VK186_23135 [Candidatus Deferrimicrobium sp.]|nr:hypothetical protein [Candidatus Deferrimicrobium sp.]